jgi:hypothetical protein
MSFFIHFIAIVQIIIGIIGVVVFWGFGWKLKERYEKKSRKLMLWIDILLYAIFEDFNYIGVGLLFFLLGIVMGVILLLVVPG